MSIISSLVDAFHGKHETPPPPPPAAPAPAPASAPAPAHGGWNPLQSVGSAFSMLAKVNPLTAPLAFATNAISHLHGDDKGVGAAGTGVAGGTQTATGGNPFAGAKSAPKVGTDSGPATGQGAGQAAGSTQNQKGTAATPQTDTQKPADPGTAPATKAPPDPKKIAADANALGKAMDAFLFTDKKAVANTLRGKSAEEISAIKEEYRKHFGRELDADIAKKIGTDGNNPLVKEVQTSLEGNPTKSYMESITRASKDGWFGGADKSKLKDLLSGMDDKTRAEVRANFKGPHGETLDQLVGDKLKGSDLNEARAYLDGNKAAADAAKIDDKMHGGLFGHGGFLGIGLGRDNKGIEQIVDNQKDKDALRKAYETQTHQNLDKDITKGLSGTQKNITQAVLDGNKAAADAGRVRQATEGWFTDKGAIYKAMEGKKPEEIAKMKEAYNQTYGTQKGGVTGGELTTVGALTIVGSPLAPIAAFDSWRKHRSDGMDFDTMLSSNMGGLDLEKAKRLEKDGKVSDAFQLKYAMHSGFFTDKAEVKRILGGKDGEGMSKEELDKLRGEFAEEQKKDPDYKPGDKVVDLDTDVRKHTGSLRDRWATQSDNKAKNSDEFLLGRDGLEIRQLLRGKATTVEDQAERANETYQMERKSSIPGANQLFDAFNGRGKTLDRQNALMNATLEKLHNGTATDEDRKELQAIMGRHKMDVTSYQETKDSVSNAAAATVAITVSAAATIATGGGASPLLAASIAAAGGTGAMVTKMALQGGAYSYDDARSDLLNTAVQAGTAGVMKLPAVDKALNGIVGIAPGATGTLMQQTIKEGLSNAGNTALTSLGQAAVNPASYQGDPNQAFWGALKSAGASSFGAALTGGLNKVGGAKLPKGYLNTFLTGVGATGAGTLATDLLNPGAMTGSSGDQAATWVTTLLGGGVGNMAALKAERNQEAARAKLAPNPEELAARQQQRANTERDAKITPEQRKAFAEIDQLKQLASNHEDWEYIRQLEHDAQRPVSQRTSAHDDLANLEAMAQSGDYGKHKDGTPVTKEEHEATIRELRQELDPQVKARRENHEGAVQGLQQELDQRIQKRDDWVAAEVNDKIAKTPKGTDGVRHIEMDGAASLGMGGAGATGAAAAKPGSRIGIEDATKPELWGTLGHKSAGQEADAIKYGKGGVTTADVAEHPTAQPARASELALQVAAQRDASEVGTLGTNGAVGDLQYRKQVGADGKTTGYTVGVPVKVGDETVVLHFPNGVDITSGMGPARELLTQDQGGRKAQLSAKDSAALKQSGQLMSGEQALARPASEFAGKEVLGIGGGPTSIWAMEHALAGGAKSTQVAGQMPRPHANTAEGKKLAAVETKIRELVLAGKPVPQELTDQHHLIVSDHVQVQENRLTQIQEELKQELPARKKEELHQEQQRIRGEIDPFLGSRVDRNDALLNNSKIKQSQADVIHVEPTTETVDGQSRERVKVHFADGTSRVVDQVIPSIGGDPNAPGGINRMLRAMPPELKLEPVIANGRVVGLSSNPPGVTISGAAMVGTLGTNMPAELMLRIPKEMRDAVVSSIIDHANREGVSAGSRGIVPGIENVGENPALMQEQLQMPADVQAKDREQWLAAYNKKRQTEFGGAARFGANVLEPKPPQYDDQVAPQHAAP